MDPAVRGQTEHPWHYIHALHCRWHCRWTADLYHHIVVRAMSSLQWFDLETPRQCPSSHLSAVVA